MTMKTPKKILKLRNKSLLIIIGLVSLIWFLIRVIPKPSRAAYPCQRAAFPVATGFIIWLTGSLISFFSFKKAREKILGSRYGMSFILFLTGTITFIVSWYILPSVETYARQSMQIFLKETAPALAQFQLTQENNLSAPRAVVSIVESDKENAADIGYDEIESMIREAVNKTGEFNGLIKDNISVVIKPNIVSTTDWSNTSKLVPSENNGMVTDWRVVKAVVKLVRELNPNGNVYILEGSADGTSRKNMEHLKYTHENIPGVTDFIFLEEHSGGWEEWNSDKLVKVELPAGKALYPNSLKPNKTSEFYLNKIYYQADVLISLPVLKNHSMTSVTGSVKNVGIGATPQNIYGGAPGDNHRYVNNRIDHKNYTNLHKFIHDFYLCRPVDYTIMEGLQGNDYGPVAEKAASLTAAQKNMRLIIAGKDAVAVDAIASLIMSYDPSKVSHLVYLHNDTAGCVDPKYIRVLGPEVNTIKKSFNHWSGTAPKFNDNIPPDATVDFLALKNNSLHFAVNPAVNEEILKIELVIDQKIFSKDIIGGYDNVMVDISENGAVDSLIQLMIYDKYLNCKTIDFTEEQWTTSHISEPLKPVVKIYPNPVNDKLVIEMQNSPERELIIEVIDLAGKVMLNKNVLNEQFTILNLEYLKSGLYKIAVRSNGQSYQQTIYKL